jgi:hypothetical protein
LPRLVREALTDPEVTCDVDVSVRREGTRRGWVQVHSGQALRAGVVAAVTSAGRDVEVAWWGADQWRSQLARAVSVSVPAATAPPPTPGVEVPLEVLLGAGEALRTNRADVLDELVGRAVGVARGPAGMLDAGEVRTQLVRLHRGVLGRLLATVAGRDRGSHVRAGWVSWVLFADGWRALTPVRVDGRPSIRVDPVGPPRLGTEVARLVGVVRGRQ